MRHLLLTLLVLMLVAVPAAAQITAPNVFSGGSIILANKVNENFNKLADALNRTGGTMTGNLLFGTDNTNDIGASGASRPKRVFAGTNVTAPAFVGGTFSGTTITGTTITGSSLVSTGGLALNGAITGATTGAFSGAVTATSFVGDLIGNAITVTNGVYTNNTYSDPSWLTALAGTKITGNISGNAGTVTNGVYTTGDQTIAGSKTFSSTITGSITGNAGTVTNGVYTNLTYADPSWINSLSSSKLSGALPAISGASLTNITPGNISSGTAGINISGTANTASAVAWSGVTSKPTTLSGYGITDAVPSSRTVNGYALSGNISLSKSDVGLGNAENTADSAKRVSYADSAGSAGSVTNGVYSTGDQTISGTKTFNSTISGNISGNAGTVTNGVYTNGTYSNPAWITALSHSKVSGTNYAFSSYGSTATAHDTTWVDTGLSAAVTPNAAGNRVFVTGGSYGEGVYSGGHCTGQMRLVRDSTELMTFASLSSATAGTSHSFTYVDAPGSGAHTYKIQIHANNDCGSAYVAAQNGGYTSTMFLLEIVP